MNRVTNVMVEMARMERICEADIFELCDKHGLSFEDEMNVFNMYQQSIGSRLEDEVTEEPVEQVDKEHYCLTAGFGTEREQQNNVVSHHRSDS